MVVVKKVPVVMIEKVTQSTWCWTAGLFCAVFFMTGLNIIFLLTRQS